MGWTKDVCNQKFAVVCVHPACRSPTLKFIVTQMFEIVDKQTADSLHVVQSPTTQLQSQTPNSPFFLQATSELETDA